MTSSITGNDENNSMRLVGVLSTVDSGCIQLIEDTEGVEFVSKRRVKGGFP